MRLHSGAKLARCARSLASRYSGVSVAGQQAWKGKTFSLLTVYPAVDATLGFPKNECIYCARWIPESTGLAIGFKLMRIIERFSSRAFTSYG